MRDRRKRQIKRHRPIRYTRFVDFYGREVVMVSRIGEAPEVKHLTGKKGRRSVA